MKKCQSLVELNSEIECEVSIAIGNFDGLHLGHKQLLRNFVVASKERKLKTIVITFNPHPVVYFSPDKRYLLSVGDKAESELLSIGIDYLLEIDFNSKLQSLAADSFFKEYLLNIKNVKLFYLGHDFKLGEGQKDSTDCLRENFPEVEIIKERSFKLDNIVLSSSMIRNLLDKGEVKEAGKYLGHNYCLVGDVIHGHGIGQKRLVATANISINKNQILPMCGVYKTSTFVEGEWFKSITNIGTNPTVIENGEVVVETHILDFNKVIYDNKVEVVFLDFIRNQIKFDSIEELRAQILKDIEVARK